MKIYIIMAALLLNACASNQKVQVWASDAEINQEKDKKILEKKGIYTHPCGYIKVLSVSSLPAPNTLEYIQGTEPVYEFNPKGKILNQWSMPVDSFLKGVFDTNILVSFGPKSLMISNNGTLSPYHQAVPSSTLTECPSSIKELFKGSDYLRCTKNIDLKTKKIRYFAHESVCT